uniref:Transient receptor potential cation channel protein painless n=1 Tax=Cacopsylla melanoneura TaxID=428564 RepID=A0A8D8PLL8_9HEMI
MTEDDLESHKKLLVRGGSLCTPDPYHQLLTALQEHDLESFRNILHQGVKREFLDPDHWYEDPHYGSLLDIACRSCGNSLYIEELLLYSADPNKINRIRHKGPLHSIVEIGDKETLQVLLKHERTNVNLLDATGSSALHIVSKNNKFELLHILLNHAKIRVNQINKKGQTAIYLAALGRHKDIVLALLKHKGINVDSAKTAQGKTARDVIVEKLPELEADIPHQSAATEEIPETNQLFLYLHQNDEESFMSCLANMKNESKDIEEIINSNDGSYTFLQYASEFGFVQSVNLLLELGANPNKTNPNNIKTPIMIAAYRGYFEIVRLLCEVDKTSFEPINDETVLHCVIQGINTCHEYLETKKKHIDHNKCFKYLLNNIRRDKINLDQTDNKGNTVLHYAAKNGNPELILMLLRHGIYIGTRNKFNEPALQDIPPRVLETYLDECLQTNNMRKEDPKYELIFRYNFLVPPKIENFDTQDPEVGLQMEPAIGQAPELATVSETDPLLYMSQSKELRPLLCHPVLTSFIHLKWFSIRRFFYINLSFYLTFWLLLSAYILTFYVNQKSSSLMRNATDPTDINEDNVQDGRLLTSDVILRLLLLLCLVIFIARELFQIIVSPLRYFKSLENWLEISLILVTAIILSSSSYNQNQISAIAILLSWAELVLLIGRYPSLSTYIEMFKTVSWNFLKFLAWYSILILAFALSFYTLFKDDTTDGNVFFDPGNSIFKTIVMLTGEFDAASIPFSDHPVTGHLLFVLFVFLIAIILFNLLNGLAVSDTQAIRTDSLLLGYISIVKLVSYIETIAIGDPTFRRLFRKAKTACCFTAESCNNVQLRRSKVFSGRVNLFPDIIPDQEIIVYPNKDSKVDFSSLNPKRKLHSSMSSLDTSCYTQCKQYHMDKEIIRAAKAIIHDRETKSDSIQEMFSDYTFRLNQYENKLENLEKTSLRNQKILEEILSTLKAKQDSDSD